jgi:hypothetical protein
MLRPLSVKPSVGRRSICAPLRPTPPPALPSSALKKGKLSLTRIDFPSVWVSITLLFILNVLDL